MGKSVGRRVLLSSTASVSVMATFRHYPVVFNSVDMHMRQRKRNFKAHERYAIWMCHEKRCWRCGEPLRLFKTSIDHVLPERLLWDPGQREKALKDFDLPSSFNIDGYENWLPMCRGCNEEKGHKIPEVWPRTRDVLSSLITKSDWVRKKADSVKKDIAKDKVLTAIFVALEEKTLSLNDLDELLIEVLERPQDVGLPGDVIILGDGYLRTRASIIREGHCNCEREVCVGEQRKIYCYFHDELSNWVIGKGLFHRCYDEVVQCSRCTGVHSRGHVGRLHYCGKPFENQSEQAD